MSFRLSRLRRSEEASRAAGDRYTTRDDGTPFSWANTTPSGGIGAESTIWEGAELFMLWEWVWEWDWEWVWECEWELEWVELFECCECCEGCADDCGNPDEDADDEDCPPAVWGGVGVLPEEDEALLRFPPAVLARTKPAELELW